MAKKQQSMSRKKRVWLILLLFIILLTIFSVFMHLNSKRVVTQEANKFQPDISWKLVYEDVEPFRYVCVDGKCPSIHRSWERSNPATCHEFVGYIPKEWGLNIEQSCETGKNRFGNTTTSYSAIGPTQDNFYIHISSDISDHGRSSYKISLSLRKN